MKWRDVAVAFATTLVCVSGCALSTSDTKGTPASVHDPPLDVHKAEYEPISEGERFGLATFAAYPENGGFDAELNATSEKLVRMAMDRATICARELSEPPTRIQQFELLVDVDGHVHVELLFAAKAYGSQTDEFGLDCTRRAFRQLELSVEKTTRVFGSFVWNLEELRASSRREAERVAGRFEFSPTVVDEPPRLVLPPVILPTKITVEFDGEIVANCALDYSPNERAPEFVRALEESCLTPKDMHWFRGDGSYEVTVSQKTYKKTDEEFLPTERPPDGPWVTEKKTVEVTANHESVVIGGEPEVRRLAPENTPFEVMVSDRLPSLDFPYAYFTLKNTGTGPLRFQNQMVGHGHIERVVDEEGGLWTMWHQSLCGTVDYELTLPPGEQTALHYGGHPMGDAAELTPGRYRLVVAFEGEDGGWVLAPGFVLRERPIQQTD